MNGVNKQTIFLPDSKPGKYFRLNPTKTCVYENTWDVPAGAKLENCHNANLPVCDNPDKKYSGKICTL